MPIYIPSSSRYLLYTGTLSHLPSGSGIFRVVQNKQAFFYELTAERFGVERLVLPTGIESIAPTRLWIAEHAAKTGYAKHVQIDEDLYFHVRQGGGVKTVVATKDDTMAEFAESSPTEVWISTENPASSKAVVKYSVLLFYGLGSRLGLSILGYADFSRRTRCPFSRPSLNCAVSQSSVGKSSM